MMNIRNICLGIGLMMVATVAAYPPPMPTPPSNEKPIVPRIHMRCDICKRVYPFQCKQIRATYLEKKWNGDKNLYKTGWKTLGNGDRIRVPAFNISALDEDHESKKSLTQHLLNEHPYDRTIYLQPEDQMIVARDCFEDISKLLDELDPQTDELNLNIDPGKQEAFDSDDSRCVTPVDQIWTTENILDNSPPKPPHRKRRHSRDAIQPQPASKKQRTAKKQEPIYHIPQASFTVYDDFADENNNT